MGSRCQSTGGHVFVMYTSLDGWGHVRARHDSIVDWDRPSSIDERNRHASIGLRSSSAREPTTTTTDRAALPLDASIERIPSLLTRLGTGIAGVQKGRRRARFDRSIEGPASTSSILPSPNVAEGGGDGPSFDHMARRAHTRPTRLGPTKTHRLIKIQFDEFGRARLFWICRFIQAGPERDGEGGGTTGRFVHGFVPRIEWAAHAGFT